MSTELHQALSELAQARVANEQATEAAEAARAKATATAEWQVYDEARLFVAASSVQLRSLADKVRDLTWRYFEQTGDKRGEDGAYMKAKRRVEYDPQALRGWCLQEAPMYVLLDKAAIERVETAQELVAHGAPIEVKETYVVNIAGDLSAYLPTYVLFRGIRSDGTLKE